LSRKWCHFQVRFSEFEFWVQSLKFKV
jgi:hypothetical protein